MRIKPEGSLPPGRNKLCDHSGDEADHDCPMAIEYRYADNQAPVAGFGGCPFRTGVGLRKWRVNKLITTAHVSLLRSPA